MRWPQTESQPGLGDSRCRDRGYRRGEGGRNKSAERLEKAVAVAAVAVVK